MWLLWLLFLKLRPILIPAHLRPNLPVSEFVALEADKTAASSLVVDKAASSLVADKAASSLVADMAASSLVAGMAAPSLVAGMAEPSLEVASFVASE